MDSTEASGNSTTTQPSNADTFVRESTDNQDSSHEGYNPLKNNLELILWDDVNRSLRHYGLQAVSFLSHQAADHLPYENVVILDNTMSAILRSNLSSLMSDCDRRQAVIQELISTTSKLQDKTCNENVCAQDLTAEVNELRALLDEERINCKDLEERRLTEIRQYTEENEALRLSRDNYHVRFTQLQRKLQQQEKETEQLRIQYNNLICKEEKRMERHDEIFRMIRKRLPRFYNTTDRTTLQVIDAYENVIENLKRDVASLRTEKYNADSVLIGNRTDVDYVKRNREPRAVLETDNSFSDQEKIFTSCAQVETGRYFDVGFEGKYKEASKKLKSAEKRIQELKANLKDNDIQNESMRRELQERPSLREWNKVKRRLHKSEQLLEDNNISLKGMRNEGPALSIEPGLSISENLENQINQMALLPCRNYLKKIGNYFKVDDLHVIWHHLEGLNAIGNTFRLMDKLIRGILELIANSNAPESSEVVRLKSLDTICEEHWQHILPTLKLWSKQLEGLKGLQESINRLASTLLPWQRSGEDIFRGKTLSVAEISAAIDALTKHGENTGVSIQESQSDPSHLEKLQRIIQHFQKLFDVKTLAGVYIKMNDVYVKLNETYNILHSLREALGLGENSLPSAIIDSVSKLIEVHNNTSYDKLKELLHVEDLQGIISRMEQYDRFFPLFRDMVEELLEILDLRDLGQIIPAVRRMKLQL